ncbi:SDR family NAD(P)-dependent oxidoreductase [Pelagicoccus sp. SDUM812003]|uniref:SDR family NAD(P)-dependent oxidoreductase n=1 Tax=Pelagicoccus sp. SDUM812003 TaxID=3041267 RepID=UPI00280CAC76|nr:SDR family NAD(P)-dependent oxidoreductase [Pelagicoccus sp. SDUM812003]MDQ8201921.1 SDR family NAD(P)-dependent oxidoreductase [Pelagicoccus sp. SDUM812003]
MELKGKEIVLTGGTSGVGLALVEALQADNTLLVIARQSERLEALKTRKENVDTLACDLGDADQLRRLEQSSWIFEGVDLLINNAAIQVSDGFLSQRYDFESMERELRLNLLAPACLTKLAACEMSRRDKGGAILNVGSALAIAPKASSPMYCSTKAGLRSLSRSIGYQLWDRGVRVLHAMLPLVDTAMTAGRGKGKITAEQAAKELIEVVEEERVDAAIGKACLLAAIDRVSPRMAQRLMRAV